MATWEMSWGDLPPTRNQGDSPTCSLEAMMYSAQVINQNHIRRGILVPQVTTFHHDSFRVNLELFTGTPLGAWWSHYNNWRVPTALDLFQNYGVAAVHAPSWYGYEQVNITSYQAHDRISFEQVQHYVSVRHPVMVVIPAAPDYYYFPPGHIYSVNPYWWQMGWDHIGYHMVMVFGCGMLDGFPYFKYLNTYGWWWGEYPGVGKVYWNEVLQYPGTEILAYTMEMDGETVPVPPYSPRPPTPPPPIYPDSPRTPDTPPEPQPPAPCYPDSPAPPMGKEQDVSSRKRGGVFEHSGEEKVGTKKAKKQ